MAIVTMSRLNLVFNVFVVCMFCCERHKLLMFDSIAKVWYSIQSKKGSKSTCIVK